MAQGDFTLLVGVATLMMKLAHCGQLVSQPTPTGTWGNEFSSGWSDEQWYAITGMRCSGIKCSTLRLLIDDQGVIQGSLQTGHSYDTDVFSDPAKVECKKDYIVTRVWCDKTFCDNLKVRCTKLKYLNWGNDESSGGEQRYWTEVLSNEDHGELRSERKCQPGTVLIGMECLDGWFCGRKRLQCGSITPPTRVVKTWWQMHQLSGGSTTDIYSVTQTSEKFSANIFATDDTSTVTSGDEKSKREYVIKTFENLKMGYTDSLGAMHARMCEPKCHEENKTGFLWMERVDLVGTDKTDDNALIPEAPEASLGFFQMMPGCLVQCVSNGNTPKCPPLYCGDEECQCCTGNVDEALDGGYPECGWGNPLDFIFVSGVVQQHEYSLLFIFSALLRIFI